METPKIDMMVIGTQKAGTTAVNAYLSQHAGIHTHEVIEFPFFLEDHLYAEGYEANFARFFGAPQEGKCVVAKNVGVMYSEEALRRLHAHNPAMQLVLVLRDPVERAYSAFWYAISRGWETIEDFGQALEAEGNSRFGGTEMALRNCQYAEYGQYAKYLALVQSIFPAEQVHTFFYEEEKGNLNGLLNAMLEIGGLQGGFPFDVSKRHNEASVPKYKWLARLTQTGGLIRKFRFVPEPLKKLVKKNVIAKNRKQFQKPPMSDAVRQSLRGKFRESNEALARMLGREALPWQ